MRRCGTSDPAVFEKLKVIRDNQLERAGLHVAAALRNLSIRTALARGATRAHIASKETAFLEARRNAVQGMHEATLDIDKLEDDLARLPQSRAKWPEVREAIHAVSKINFDSADESFRVFSNLVEMVNDLDRIVLNESALILDHEHIAFHLVLIAFEHVNDSSEFIGRSRALVTAALFRGRITDQDRILFQGLMNQNLATEKKIEEHLNFLGQTNESAAAKIRPLFQEYEAARTEFQRLAQEILDGDVRGGEGANRIFSFGTKTIETQSKLMQRARTNLNSILHRAYALLTLTC
ncbi:MAG: nitrate- and nitrite sensing domain-containing protein [Leptospirales bacterium]|nr:nitrate- and nitrite sensing domain-containing protein [Leptospirales bacterium]